MGAAESKIQFKSHFNELTSTSDISEENQIWNFILGDGIESRELCSLVPAKDVREVKETHPENFETLLKVCIKRLVQSTRPSAIGSHSEQPVLSSIRVLTRVLPLAYEGDSTWSIDYIWKSTLGKDLIDTVAKLFYYPGFTVESDQQIWTQGVGTVLDFRPSARMVENRIEVMRLLLVALSQPLYSEDTPYGLNYMVSELPKAQIMTIFCSLFNTSLANARSIWNKPFEEEVVRTSQAAMAHLSQQLFLTLVVHVNSEGKPNVFRKLLSKIRQKDDLELVVSRLVVKLDASIENLALMWECVQANQGVLDHLGGVVLDVCKRLVDIVLHSSPQEVPRTASYLLLFLTSRQDIAPSIANELLGLAAIPMNQHVDVVLRILYNVCPFWSSLDVETSVELTRFVREVTINGTPKQIVWATKLVKQTLASLQEGAKPLAFEMSKVAWPGILASWFAEYAREVKESDPVTFEAVQMPKVLTEDYRSINFEWSPERLRWYASIIWGTNFRYDQQVFGPGAWTGTHIELFRVEKVNLRPSLRRPRGAVDAVADVVAERAKNWIMKNK